jgi:hypothetical protein
MIDEKDLLKVFVSESGWERSEAMRRLIEAAWKRGWEDAHKALAAEVNQRLSDPVRRSILEDEIEFGML